MAKENSLTSVATLSDFDDNNMHVVHGYIAIESM